MTSNFLSISIYIDDFGSLESVKAASDLFAPVSGEIVEINNNLLDNPGLINSSPLDEGVLQFIILLILFHYTVSVFETEFYHTVLLI